jgi:ribosomal protein L11 methyltransferase
LSAGTGWTIGLAVPAAALPVFEAALATLGEALAMEPPDPTGVVPLTLYMAQCPDQVKVAALLAAAAATSGVPVPDFTVERLPDIDWVAESQEALPPIRAGRFYVYGSHVIGPPPSASIPIRIDANTAFGTGRHETTRGCLIALTRLAKGRRFRRTLDMGCGSGVLAIAMAKLWPIAVLAADNDSSALRVAHENARINRVAARLRVVASDGYANAVLHRWAPFDLIVANILAEPLAAMAPDLARHLAPGGIAVLSGLLASQQRAVLAPHRGRGLRLKARIVLGDWATLILGR